MKILSIRHGEIETSRGITTGWILEREDGKSLNIFDSHLKRNPKLNEDIQAIKISQFPIFLTLDYQEENGKNTLKRLLLNNNETVTSASNKSKKDNFQSEYAKGAIKGNSVTNGINIAIAKYNQKEMENGKTYTLTKTRIMKEIKMVMELHEELENE